MADSGDHDDILNVGDEDEEQEDETTSRTENDADGDGDDTIDDAEDDDVENIKAQVRELEEEAQKLRQLQEEQQLQMGGAHAPAFPTKEEKVEADGRSIYVGGVDYSATAEELEAHFHGCGPINRVTILCDKFTSHPKGFAYVEFADKDSVDIAVGLNDSLFKGRQLKVSAKRTNVPGISTTNRGRGRGRFRGRGGFYGGYRPRRGGYRGRRGWFSPY